MEEEGRAVPAGEPVRAQVQRCIWGDVSGSRLGVGCLGGAGNEGGCGLQR